jgi:hypothetical protein
LLAKTATNRAGLGAIRALRGEPLITDFDDYMIHQAPVPINQPSVTDRNFYDRYWFNGCSRSEELGHQRALS